MENPSARQRMIKVYEGEVPDRIPYSILLPEWARERLEKDLRRRPEEVFHLDCGARDVWPCAPGKPPWDMPWDNPPDNMEEERILRRRFRNYLPDDDAPGARVTEDGVLTVAGSLYHLRRMFHPLEKAKDPKELDDYPFADYTEGWRWKGIEEEIKKLKKQGFFVVGGVGFIYESAWYIRGQQQLLIDLYENPSFAEKLLDVITERRRLIAVRLAKMGVDAIGCGDDMGHQGGLLMSLPMLKEWILSRWEGVISAARQINPAVFVQFHSDGKNEEAIPEMMRIGVNAINPVQPECDDPEHLKRKFGRKLVLCGTLSSRTYTFGTPQQVKEEIKVRMETGKRWGGLILSHNNTPDVNTPYENMRAFLEAAEEYGKVD